MWCDSDIHLGLIWRQRSWSVRFDFPSRYWLIHLMDAHREEFQGQPNNTTKQVQLHMNTHIVHPSRMKTIISVAFMYLGALLGHWSVFALNSHSVIGRGKARRQSTTTLLLQSNDNHSELCAYDAEFNDWFLTEDTVSIIDRRTMLQRTCFISASAALPTLTARVSSASAAERRQLELCLVIIWRVLYWVQGLLYRWNEAAGNREAVQQIYLEARLGSKSCLTGGKNVGVVTGIPPIAAKNLYTLSTLQFASVLDDLQAVHNTKAPFATKCRDWYESLASLVEFDGLDSLTDPSPRPQLLINQITDKKLVYVKRMMQERIVPLARELIFTFPDDARTISQSYVERYYANEIPPAPAPVPSPTLIMPQNSGGEGEDEEW